MTNASYYFEIMLGDGKDDYNIKKAIINGEIFKIEKGLYSDKENVHYLKVLSK